MKNTRTKGDKKEIRQETHLTRPPRLEGVVKEAKMQPKKKPKKPVEKPKKKAPSKQQDTHTDAQRKQYHLKSPKPKRARA